MYDFFFEMVLFMLLIGLMKLLWEMIVLIFLFFFHRDIDGALLSSQLDLTQLSLIKALSTLTYLFVSAVFIKFTFFCHRKLDSCKISSLSEAFVGANIQQML